MNARILRWIVGVALAGAVGVGIFYLGMPSLLEWQSKFLARAFWWLLFCAALALFRVLKGPTAADRAVAVDMLGILIIGLCAVLSLATGRDWYIDIAIAWALQSFIGILALAKYLEGKDFDE